MKYYIELVNDNGVLKLPETEKLSGLKITIDPVLNIAIVETTEKTVGEDILRKYDIGEQEYERRKRELEAKYEQSQTSNI
jgi:hypothetical protein